MLINQVSFVSQKQKYAPSVFEKYVTTVSVGGKEIKLNLYDTAGKILRHTSSQLRNVWHLLWHQLGTPSRSCLWVEWHRYSHFKRVHRLSFSPFCGWTDTDGHRGSDNGWWCQSSVSQQIFTLEVSDMMIVTSAVLLLRISGESVLTWHTQHEDLCRPLRESVFWSVLAAYRLQSCSRVTSLSRKGSWSQDVVSFIHINSNIHLGVAVNTQKNWTQLKVMLILV